MNVEIIELVSGEFPGLIDQIFCIMLRCMPLTEDIINSRYRISGYQNDAVIVNEVLYRQSLLLSAEYLHHPWAANSVKDLSHDNLELIFSLKPEVVLLGTGTLQKFPAAKILTIFGQEGIGLEVMDNGALCRTFNILVAEDRAVVAAILLNS